MKIGMGLRNMGDVADRDTLTTCAQAADNAGIERKVDCDTQVLGREIGTGRAPPGGDPRFW